VTPERPLMPANPVLEHKLSHQRVGRSPLPDIELIGENFGRILEENLRKLLKTNVGALILDCEVTKLAQVVDQIPVPAMLGVVELGGSDHRALINLTSDLVFHVVDMRMGGDSSQAVMPTTRSFTGIDTALCMGFFEVTLGSLLAGIEESVGAPVNRTLKVVQCKQDISTIRIAPKSADVLQMLVSLDIGAAARSGDFELVLPLSVLDVFRAETKQSDLEFPEDTDDHWLQHMRESVGEASLPVSAILQTRRMALADVKALKVGQVLPLPSEAVGSVDMVVAQGMPQQLSLAKAKLGVFQGNKVVKLTEGVARDVQDYLSRCLAVDTDPPKPAPKALGHSD